MFLVWMRITPNTLHPDQRSEKPNPKFKHNPEFKQNPHLVVQLHVFGVDAHHFQPASLIRHTNVNLPVGIGQTSSSSQQQKVAIGGASKQARALTTMQAPCAQTALCTTDDR
jgi:hypothetical protein